MGLFDSFKEATAFGKNAEWKVGTKPAILTLEDNHLDIKYNAGGVQIFYKDIQQIETVGLYVKIKTMADSYTLSPVKIRKGKEMAKELHAQLLEKVANNKASQDNQTLANTEGVSPSFCGNCGQALNGENFCPSCGTEVRKI